MDHSDQAAGLLPTSPRQDAGLRIYDPGVSRRDEVVCRSGSSGPEMGPCDVNGFSCHAFHWTEEEWSSLRAAERPRDAFPGNRGGWFRVARDPDA
jgi:hypothetical protein